jgi:hypothetical protein
MEVALNTITLIPLYPIESLKQNYLKKLTMSEQYTVWKTVLHGNKHIGVSKGTWRKPLNCRKSLTTLSHNVESSTLRHERGSNSQR